MQSPQYFGNILIHEKKAYFLKVMVKAKRLSLLLNGYPNFCHTIIQAKSKLTLFLILLSKEIETITKFFL